MLCGFGRYIVATTMTRDEVNAAHAAGAVLKVTDAFEFSSQMQVGQAPHPTDPRQVVPTLGKMNIVFRVDAACYSLPMDFSLHGAVLYWLDDLNQSDAAAYKDLINQAVRMGEGWAEQRAESKSGLKLTSQMPPGPGAPNGFRA